MAPDDAPAKPLEGTRVVDLSAALPGPYCTQLLADLGAEVVKVERPGGGDYLRLLMPGVFRQFNRGKQSVVLDLKDDADRATFWRLLESADVLLEGFRPGVMTRLGLSADQVRRRLPRLVYCSISGWGQAGPLAKVPAHDLNYLGAVGALHDPLTGEVSGQPTMLVADLAAGMAAAAAILAALLSRAHTNEGATIDLAMADVVMQWAMATHAAQAGGDDATAEISPAHGVFRTADGRLVTLGAIEDHFWDRFCAIAQDPRLSDPRFRTHARRNRAFATVRRLLEEVMCSRTAAEWITIAQDADVPILPVHTFAEALDQPHFKERAMIVPAGDGGPLRTGFPARWDGALLTAGTTTPEPGDADPGQR
ncbi:MAG: CoA transferase [Micromonosporaceae bacterium]|nr:CoA transferase [Micromonosporaceae bacterium]